MSVTQFVLTDGKVQAPTAGAEVVQKTLTVGDLLDRYLVGVQGVLEESTCLTLRIHSNHLKRLVGANTPVASLTRDTLQDYVSSLCM